MDKLKTEAEARQDLKDYMDSLSDERRIKAERQQWVIDGVARRIKDPYTRSQVLHQMMMSEFNKLNQKLKELTL